MKIHEIPEAVTNLPATLFWWLYALPRTFREVALRPGSVAEHVRQQAALPPDKRHQKFLAAEVCFALCVVAPLFLTVQIAARCGWAATHPVIAYLHGHYWQTIPLLGLFLAVGPGVGAYRVLRGGGAPADLEGFLQALRVQYYILSPLGPLFMLAFWAMLLLTHAEATPVVTFTVYAATLYMAYAEAAVALREFAGKRDRLMLTGDVVLGGACIWPAVCMLVLNVAAVPFP